MLNNFSLEWEALKFVFDDGMPICSCYLSSNREVVFTRDNQVCVGEIMKDYLS